MPKLEAKAPHGAWPGYVRPEIAPGVPARQPDIGENPVAALKGAMHLQSRWGDPVRQGRSDPIRQAVAELTGGMRHPPAVRLAGLVAGPMAHHLRRFDRQ
jgi:hypothetical protein